MKLINKKDGFMVVEVLIAISIITISILASMLVTERSLYASRLSFHTTQASFLLEEGAEAVRILRDNNWTNISSLSSDTDYYLSFDSGTWVSSGTPEMVGSFTRSFQVSNVNRDDTTKDISVSGTNDPGTKLVTIRVMWNEGANVVTKVLQFYVMDTFS